MALNTIVNLKFIATTECVVKTSCFRNRSKFNLTFLKNLPPDFHVNIHVQFNIFDILNLANNFIRIQDVYI